jgi:hypothetical protein
VQSQGQEVVRPGYSMMSSAATTGKDKGRCWDNPNWVTRVTDKGRILDNSNQVTRVSSIDQQRLDHTEQVIQVRDKGQQQPGKG